MRAILFLVSWPPIRPRTVIRGGVSTARTGRCVTTADRALRFVRYDHFLSDKLFVFNSATFTRDEFAKLKLRTTFANGLDYQAVETQRRTPSAETGLACVNEDFDIAPDDSFPSARCAVNFEHALQDGLNPALPFSGRLAGTGGHERHRRTHAHQFSIQPGKGLRRPT